MCPSLPLLMGAHATNRSLASDDNDHASFRQIIIPPTTPANDIACIGFNGHLLLFDKSSNLLIKMLNRLFPIGDRKVRLTSESCAFKSQFHDHGKIANWIWSFASSALAVQQTILASKCTLPKISRISRWWISNAAISIARGVRIEAIYLAHVTPFDPAYTVIRLVYERTYS